MIFLWLGVALLAMKWAELGPIADLSWGWVLAPLVLAFIWFEWGERALGRDKQRVEHVEYENRRKERVAAAFATDPRDGKRRAKRR